jgi:hypothetical protein
VLLAHGLADSVHYELPDHRCSIVPVRASADQIVEVLRHPGRDAEGNLDRLSTLVVVPRSHAPDDTSESRKSEQSVAE